MPTKPPTIQRWPLHRLIPNGTQNGIQTNWLLSWRFLHPFAWFIFFCVAGPLMLRLLSINVLHHNILDVGHNYTMSATSACDVDEVWSSWSTIFQIYIRTGKLSFTAAKVIDIALDLVVGRGGQFVLGWISYRVYTDTFTHIASRHPVACKLFTSINIDPTACTSLKTYVSAIFSKESSKLTLLWLITTVSYLLAYPKLVSASTSLVGATISAIQLPFTATAPPSSYISSAAYKFTNSGLIDKPKPWIVYTSIIHRLPANTPDNIIYINANTYSWFDRNDKLLINTTTYIISKHHHHRCGFLL